MRLSVKIAVLAIAAGAFLGLHSAGSALAAPGTTIWAHEYTSRPASDGDSVKGLAIDENGALALAGTVTGKDGSHGYLTIKYGPYGTFEWASEFSPSWFNVARAVTFDNAGNVYAAGTSYNLDNPRDSYSRSYYTDYRIIKYNPSGEPIMEAAASGFKKNNDPAGIAADGSGSFYVTGTAKTTTDTYPIFYTVKFDPEGSIQWEKSDDWGAESYATGIKLAPDGNIVVAGWFRDPSLDNLSIRVLRYDASSGKTLTDVAYNNEQDDEKAWGVAVDADGNILVAGETNANDGVTLTLKFAPDGQLVWANPYRGSQYSNRGNAVAVDREGNVYVAGKTIKGEQSGDWLLLVYNKDGRLVLDKTYPLGGDAGAEGIAVDIYGNIAITGNVKMPDQPPFIKTLRLEGLTHRQGSR
jgi:sugar lactone lactonase YvrE